MSSPAPRSDPYAEWRALPDTVIGEVVHGQLYTQPRPTVRHAHACSVLGEELGPPFRRGRGGPGGWILLDEPEIHLGAAPDILVSDLAGWRTERVAQLPATAYVTIVPDWVCEVLSPSTQRVDRAEKRDAYRREGVHHLWLVDPDARTLEIFRLVREPYVLAATYAGDAGVRAEPFDAITLELALLWQP